MTGPLRGILLPIQTEHRLLTQKGAYECWSKAATVLWLWWWLTWSFYFSKLFDDRKNLCLGIGTKADPSPQTVRQKIESSGFSKVCQRTSALSYVWRPKLALVIPRGEGVKRTALYFFKAVGKLIKPSPQGGDGNVWNRSSSDQNFKKISSGQKYNVTLGDFTIGIFPNSLLYRHLQWSLFVFSKTNPAIPRSIALRKESSHSNWHSRLPKKIIVETSWAQKENQYEHFSGRNNFLSKGRLNFLWIYGICWIQDFFGSPSLRSKVYQKLKEEFFKFILLYRGLQCVLRPWGGAKRPINGYVKNYLEWTRKNFGLNKISLNPTDGSGQMLWNFCMDLYFEQFDLIFSRSSHLFEFKKNGPKFWSWKIKVDLVTSLEVWFKTKNCTFPIANQRFLDWTHFKTNIVPN